MGVILTMEQSLLKDSKNEPIVLKLEQWVPMAGVCR